MQWASDGFQTNTLINFPGYFHHSTLFPQTSTGSCSLTILSLCVCVCVNMIYLSVILSAFLSANISLQPSQFPHSLMIILCPLTFVHAVFCFFRNFEEVIYLCSFLSSLFLMVSVNGVIGCVSFVLEGLRQVYKKSGKCNF